METLNRNITFTRGDTYGFNMVFTDLEQDLDAAFLTCRVAKDKASQIVFQKSLNDGITKTDTDTYTVRIAPEDTADLELGTYYYDLEFSVSGDTYTPLKGKIKLTWEVS